jgi:hypothetical protein
VGQRLSRRRWIAGIAIALSVLIVGAVVSTYVGRMAVRRREAGAVETLRGLGFRIEDQFVEEDFPLGRMLPGAARYRYVMRLERPRVTDDELAVLDRLDPDRVATISMLNAEVGDATLRRAARFPHMTLLALGQAIHNPWDPWPTRPSGRMTDAGFAPLAHMTELRTVGLHGPDVTDAALASLSDARKLRELILYGSRVTGAGLAALGPKPELIRLKVGGTRIGDADLAVLGQFPALEELDLRETAVTDAGLARLQALPRLKRLWLGGCNVTDEAVANLKRARPLLAVDRSARPKPPSNR